MAGCPVTISPVAGKPDGDHVQQCADDWKSGEIPGTTKKLQDTEFILVSEKAQRNQRPQYSFPSLRRGFDSLHPLQHFRHFVGN
jgi:hypothetical protein